MKEELSKKEKEEAVEEEENPVKSICKENQEKSRIRLLQKRQV